MTRARCCACCSTGHDDGTKSGQRSLLAKRKVNVNMTPKLTRDLDDYFFPRLDEIASSLGAQPRHMLAVMYSESGVSATAHNDAPKDRPPEKRYNASGLIQFMPATLPGLGWTAGHAAFRRLSATEQLTFVDRYYRPHRGHLDSIAGLYVATFLPALVRHAKDRSFVLTGKAGPLGWAYEPNAVFDRNRDLAITVGELEDAVARNARGARWDEILMRLEGASSDAPLSRLIPDGGTDLGSTMGLQRALARLGYDPGPVDGLPGPRTRAAVVAFQSAAGLVPDGVIGPLTRGALQRAFAG